MSALVQLPSAEELLTRADFDAFVVLVAEALEVERDLGKLHRFAEEAAAQARVIGRLQREVDAAKRASVVLERVAAFANFRLGEVLAELDGGYPGGPQSARSEAIEEAQLQADHARRLVKLAELGQERAMEAVERLEAEGRRPSTWAILDATKTEPPPSPPNSEEDDEERDTDECYTPARFLEAAREVIGGRFDEDLASCVVAQLVVQAERFWTKAKPELGEAERAAGITPAKLELLKDRCAGTGELFDPATGELVVEDLSIADPKKRRRAFARAANKARLLHAEQLAGKVWCNPPYSFPAPFIRAIVEGYLGRPFAEVLADLEGKAKRDALRAAAAEAKGPITEAIVLLNVAPGTAAQQLALPTSAAQCWVEGRIDFNDATGKPIGGSNRYEQVFFYFGPNPKRFAEIFERFGTVTFTRSP